MNYCTLFDSNYLDKGLTMIDSLLKEDRNASIYVLCMDDLCLKILKEEMNDHFVHIIPISDFLDDELSNVKESRTRGEFCWTCTAKLIKYCITFYNCQECSYVDSDLYFYSTPEVIISEMKKNNCTVQTTSHRFLPNKNGRILEEKNGKNCVQFITFTNEKRSLDLLDTWIKQCIHYCSFYNGGDQKYTEEWNNLDYVLVSKNGGAGLAPWNIDRFVAIDLKNFKVYDRFDKKEYYIVFYHFQHVVYHDRYSVDISRILEKRKTDCDLATFLYTDYVNKIEEKKQLLESKYGICPMVNVAVSDSSANRISLKKVFSSDYCNLFESVSHRIFRRIRQSKSTIIIKKVEKNHDNA